MNGLSQCFRSPHVMQALFRQLWCRTETASMDQQSKGVTRITRRSRKATIYTERKKNPLRAKRVCNLSQCNPWLFCFSM